MAVYFLRAGYSGPVKIGTAEDVAARVLELQCAHYEPLRVLRVVDGSYEIETAYHRRYAHLRIKREWFHYDADMLTAAPVPMGKVAVYTPDARELEADRALIETLRKRFGSMRSLAIAFGVEYETLKKWRNRSGIAWRYRQRAQELLTADPRPGISTPDLATLARHATASGARAGVG